VSDAIGRERRERNPPRNQTRRTGGVQTMPDDRTLNELRAEFSQSPFLAMPIAGTVAWTAAGVLGALLPEKPASYALFFCMGSIFPLGLLLARWTGEDLLGSKTQNDLDRLFGLNVLMANLVWAIAIPLWMIHPSSLPLSAGVLAGLMWIPFSWMLQHWVGLFHGIARTVLVAAAWFLFPAQRFVLIPAVIVLIYGISIVALVTRPQPAPSRSAAS
jgi:hypothetical protein